MKKSLGDEFCLVDGRESFTISPDDDPDLYFGRSELQKELTKRIEKDAVRGRPVKFILMGDYGTGKTHTMRHLEHTLRNGPENIITVYVETGDLGKKSKFDILYGTIMKRIGPDEIQKLLSGLEEEYRTSELRAKLNEMSKNRDIPAMLMNFVLQKDNLDIWRWFLGEQLNNAQLKTFNISTNLSTLGDYIEALSCIGRLYKAVTGKRLLIMVDEAETIGRVTEQDAETNWEHALRKLYDDRNDQVGIVFSLSIRSLDDPDAPEVFQRSPVASRIPIAQRITLEPFGDEDLAAFVRDLIKGLTKSDCVEERVKALDNVTADTYPFDEDAWNMFVTMIAQDATLSKPRIAIKTLDEAVAEAYLSGKSYIDAITLESMPHPQE